MDGSIPPTFPLRVSTPPVSARSPQFTARPASPAEAIARTRVDTFEGTARATEKVSKLVAGAVDVPVSFDAGAPAPAGEGAGALPMYRHPADKNAAATGVTLGRRVDVTG